MSGAVIYTQNELEARCKIWQERLRLQDWIVYCRLSPHTEFSNDTMANVRVSVGRKEALIQIIAPDHYSHLASCPQDMELSLVHELLHLHLEPMGMRYDDPKQFTEEQAINSISTSLVRAWRRVEELVDVEVQSAARQQEAA
jgi:hypothetical protein